MKTEKIKLNNGFAPYPEYKDSGIEWIGKIPKEWKLVKFKGLFSVSNERVEDDRSVCQILSVSGYRGIEKKNIAGMDGQMPSEDISLYRVVRPGQLVVNTMWLNYSGLGVSKYTGYVSPAYRAYDISDSMNPDFVHYLLRSIPYVQKYSSLLYGIRPNSLQVKPMDFERIEVLAPSREDQNRIAEYLDEKTELIDRIIERKKRLIELLREKRTAVINQAVTKGLDPNVELVDSGIEWIGMIPKGWEVKKLKHFVKTTTSGVWGENQLNNVDDVRCLRIADFDYDNLSYSEVDTVRNIDGLKKEKILKKGDILVEKSGGGEKTPVGRAILFNSTEKMVCANFIDIVRVDASEMIPEYFAISLSALYAKRVNVKYIKQNTGIQNLDLKAYFSEYIGYPSLDIQRKIVEYSHLKIMQSFELQSKVEESIKTLKEFKSSLISNIVTGKIQI